MSEPVFFWLQDEKPYGVFSQWAPSPFIDKDGLRWENMEQFFMAMKAKTFNDKKTYDLLRKTSSPKSCKALGRQVSSFNESKWKKKSMMVAYVGNMMKYNQNEDLKALLLGTGERPLYESSPRDFVWGIGLTAVDAATIPPSQYPGANCLGKTLMKVRASLRGSPESDTSNI